MIKIDNITKIYVRGEHRRVVFDGASATLDTSRSYGLLGPNGAGKTTLLRLIAGSDAPTRGRVTRDVRVSWPMGYTGGMHADMTGRENIIFVARAYGADVARTIDFVEDFAELGRYLDVPVRTYSSGMRSRLAFGMSFAIDFECYLVDEAMSAGDARFKARAKKLFTERSERCSMIIVSHGISTIREYCDHCMVVHQAKLVMFDDVDEGIAFHKKTLA
jgi:capsular polysaccharide transport system ATP-binding protein